MQFRRGSLIDRAAAAFLLPRSFATPGFRRSVSNGLPLVISNQIKKEGRARSRIRYFFSLWLERLGFISPTHPHFAQPLPETVVAQCHHCPDPFEGAVFHPARMLRRLTPDEKTVVERLLRFRLVESRLQATFIVAYLAETGFDPVSITQAQQIAMWSGSELAPVDLDDPIIWIFVPERPLRAVVFWPLTTQRDLPGDDEAD